MIEKNGTWGEGLDVRRVQILEAKASVGYGGINIDREFIKGKEHQGVCIIYIYIYIYIYTWI